jgi:hypothetical protein
VEDKVPQPVPRSASHGANGPSWRARGFRDRTGHALLGTAAGRARRRRTAVLMAGGAASGRGREPPPRKTWSVEWRRAPPRPSVQRPRPVQSGGPPTAGVAGPLSGESGGACLTVSAGAGARFPVRQGPGRGVPERRRYRIPDCGNALRGLAGHRMAVTFRRIVRQRGSEDALRRPLGRCGTTASGGTAASRRIVRQRGFGDALRQPAGRCGTTGSGMTCFGTTCSGTTCSGTTCFGSTCFGRDDRLPSIVFRKSSSEGL